MLTLRKTRLTDAAVRARPFLVLPLLLLACPFLFHCSLWSAHNTLSQARHEVAQAKGINMEEAALYHLTIAQNLLEAAEKQYEEADFPATVRFARKAQEQVRRARQLHDFHEGAEPSALGKRP